MSRIYLDYNATAPIDPHVLNVLIKALEEDLGNPSSTHFDGQQARKKLESSRNVIAEFFQVKPAEVIFTSCGTEGASLLLQGILAYYSNCHVISSTVEHACVYQTLKEYEKKGSQITFLRTGARGSVLPEDVEKAIRPDTRLITIMAANNETGVLTDIQSIAAIAERHHIPFIVDGVAWLGKEKIKIPSGVSGVFFSGHKIYGPKGIGFCICKRSLKLTPLFFGGGQEFNRRSGTENLPAIIALAEAVSLIEKNQEAEIMRILNLRDYFEQQLLQELTDIVINGIGLRICNTSNISFLGVEGETLLMNLDMEGISVSHGSACASGGLEPSRILLEMGLSVSQARSSIRFSIGRMTTKEEIDQALSKIISLVKKLKKKF